MKRTHTLLLPRAELVPQPDAFIAGFPLVQTEQNSWVMKIMALPCDWRSLFQTQAVLDTALGSRNVCPTHALTWFDMRPKPSWQGVNYGRGQQPSLLSNLIHLLFSLFQFFAKIFFCYKEKISCKLGSHLSTSSIWSFTWSKTVYQGKEKQMRSEGEGTYTHVECIFTYMCIHT